MLQSHPYPLSTVKLYNAFDNEDMVGSGVTDYGNVGLMPISQPPSSSIVSSYGTFVVMRNILVLSSFLGFRSEYTHDTEKITPGYYSVYLADPQV